MTDHCQDDDARGTLKTEQVSVPRRLLEDTERELAGALARVRDLLDKPRTKRRDRKDN